MKRKPGMRPVRSNRSNPALKQDLGKARFFAKRIRPPTDKSSGGGRCGVEIVFAKPWQGPTGCLAGRRPCFCQSLSRYLRQIRMNGFLKNQFAEWHCGDLCFRALMNCVRRGRSQAQFPYYPAQFSRLILPKA